MTLVGILIGIVSISCSKDNKENGNTSIPETKETTQLPRMAFEVVPNQEANTSYEEKSHRAKVEHLFIPDINKKNGNIEVTAFINKDLKAIKFVTYDCKKDNTPVIFIGGKKEEIIKTLNKEGFRSETKDGKSHFINEKQNADFYFLDNIPQEIISYGCEICGLFVPIKFDFDVTFPSGNEMPLLVPYPMVDKDTYRDDIIAHEKAVGRILTQRIKNVPYPEGFFNPNSRIKLVIYNVGAQSSSGKTESAILAGADGDRMSVLKPFFDKELSGWKYLSTKKDEETSCQWQDPKTGWKATILDGELSADEFRCDHAIIFQSVVDAKIIK